MSTLDPAASQGGTRFLRVWLPVVVLGVAALVVTGLWAWPDIDWPRERSVTYTTLTALLAVLALAAWLLLFSGWRWIWRINLLVALVVVLLGSIRTVKFTGDMVPIVYFRWNSPHDDIVEAHRRSQSGAVPPVELPQNGPGAYPEYRGRNRDGVVEGPPLHRDWVEHPPRELWRQPIGGGYAGFAVAGNLAVTIEQRREEEAVVGYDTATGRERWLYSYPAHFDERMGGPGPRATPTIAGGRVYSLGATGVLVCLEAATGQKQWQVNVLEGNENIQWGMSGSPLVYDQVVVVNPGSQTAAARGRAVLAFDRDTGQPVWAAGSHRASYGSPMLATLAGRRPVLIFDAAGLGGHDAQTGEELWRFPWVTDHEINVAQPVVLDGDRVFISSGYGHGCAMLKVGNRNGEWSVEQLWKTHAMHCKFTSPVAYQGHLYGLDEGILVCVDAETGKRKWKDGRYQHGQLLLTGDLLVIFSEDGRLVLVEATPEAHRELASLKVFDEQKNWNHLALAEGRVYLRNHREMACCDLAALQ